ncbi:hypothetical protein G6F31_021874 [Rhizopus arrhizus]|nr:hypothetical protein G6F31_021874 [Rhizopus arrhizus]
MGAGQHGLDDFRATFAGQVPQRREQLGAHRILAKERARHRDHQDQHGRQREHHVQSQGCPFAGGAMA